MSDAAVLVDMFVRGVAVGGLITIGLGVLRSGASRDAKIASVFACLSLSAWLITESEPLWGALGHAYPLIFAAYPVSGAFWLLVVVVFEDRPVTAGSLSPAAVLIVTGMMTAFLPTPARDVMWASRNAAGGLLMLHAAFVIARGWRGDLLQARRRARAVLLGFGAVFGAAEVVLALANRLHPMGRLTLLETGELYGGMIMAVTALASASVFLQVRPTMFGAGRRSETVDARAEAADRAMLVKLDSLMAAESWRREGLTIGQLADELGLPEHRLRRLINNRLGHRNFADFLNVHRIEAAKQRLGDPAEARTTVAAIAFDLGYRSLGPFNRAFREATGAALSEWRREALERHPSR